jgi:glycosyltransferase involved in cell wall biosynthesis
MKTTCLVSNYNYAQYLGDAIDAALDQTVPFDEIIVVDDGSKDGSVELLKSRYGQNPAVEIISKANQGQLSCFNEGFARSNGDLVFFLDSADLFEPDYVENALAVYRQAPSCDFLFCGRQLFGQQTRTLMAFPTSRDLGYSLVETAYARSWIGAATSCVSMRRSLLRKILPLPYVDEWRVRADDCLVFGASLAGGRKRFLASPLVRYRVHGKNQHRNRKKDHCEIYRRRIAVNRLFEHFEREQCFNTARLAEIGHREFLTVARPTLRQWMTYAGISMGAPIALHRRLGFVAEMFLHFVATLRNAATADLRVDSRLEPGEILPMRVHTEGTATGGPGGTHTTLQGRRPA